MARSRPPISSFKRVASPRDQLLFLFRDPPRPPHLPDRLLPFSFAKISPDGDVVVLLSSTAPPSRGRWSSTSRGDADRTWKAPPAPFNFNTAATRGIGSSTRPRRRRLLLIARDCTFDFATGHHRPHGSLSDDRSALPHDPILSVRYTADEPHDTLVPQPPDPSCRSPTAPPAAVHDQVATVRSPLCDLDLTGIAATRRWCGVADKMRRRSWPRESVSQDEAQEFREISLLQPFAVTSF